MQGYASTVQQRKIKHLLILCCIPRACLKFNTFRKSCELKQWCNFNNKKQRTFQMLLSDAIFIYSVSGFFRLIASQLRMTWKAKEANSPVSRLFFIKQNLEILQSRSNSPLLSRIRIAGKPSLEEANFIYYGNFMTCN